MTPIFTILTPAYNRSTLLPILYKSLCSQKQKKFEWIIIDDDSTDNTEEVVNTFHKSGNDFEIMYLKQKHGGKHRAVNLGVKKATANFIFIVDSDDYLAPYASSCISEWITQIENDPVIAGVSGKKIYPNGKTVGTFPNIKENSYIDVPNTQRYRRHLTGDKAEVYRKDILLRYPFPEFKGEDFVTERICWDKISHDGYVIRWYNTPIYICEYHEGGLSKTGANSITGHLKNPNGYTAFVKQSIKILEPPEAVTYFREYNTVSKIMKKTISERAHDIDLSILSYINYLYLKMPIYYAIRLAMKLFRVI